MTYKINFQTFSDSFTVPAEIVGADFDKLDNIFLKVILLIIKNSGKNYSVSLISNLLNISQSEVEKAIQYWMDKGMLIRASDEPLTPQQVVVLQKHSAVAPPRIENVEIAFLSERMEEKLKRPITPVEHKALLHILEFIKLPADVVMMAIEYCVSIDKVNARYLEKVCASWADHGVTTHDKAEQYLNYLQAAHSNEQQIKSIFGINDRNLIDSEKESIARWINEYSFSIDMIQYAYDRMITAIGKLSFPYINKILLTWNEKGFTSISDVTNQKAMDKASKSKVVASYDLEEIDKFWDNVPKLV